MKHLTEKLGKQHQAFLYQRSHLCCAHGKNVNLKLLGAGGGGGSQLVNDLGTRNPLWLRRGPISELECVFTYPAGYV